MTTTAMATTAEALTARERARVERAQRFLTNVVDVRIAPVAASLGYDDEEHSLGWSYWEMAAGHGRAFSESMILAGVAPGPKPAQVWTQLDQFENKWFPRTRNAIRRFVDAGEREQVERAFFLDLNQQPDGPMVVGSVGLYLERLEGLRTSGASGAAQAWESLVKKGLTDDELARVQGLLTEARSTPEPAPEPKPEDVLAARVSQQRAGYEQLNLWFTDWADVLRDELPYHHRVRLGITEVRGGHPGANESADAGSDTDTPPQG